jgi:hypothetical protein
VPGSFVFLVASGDVRRVPKIFRQTRNSRSVARLVLHAVNPVQSACCSKLARKARDSVQPHRRGFFAFVSQSNLNTVRTSLNRHCQVRVLRRQIFKGFFTRCDYGFMQFNSGIARQPSCLR